MDNFLKGAQDFFNNVLFQNIPKLLIALVVLWVGLKLIKLLCKGFKKVMVKRDIDVSLQTFLTSLIDVSLKILLVITVMGMIGIHMTSFIAVLGAAGLAVGMALQGTLQNFAGGVIILLLKPYRVGDYIEQGGVSGTVQKILIFNTILITPDNKVIIVPNTELATKTLINYTRSDQRRVDVNVGIAYGQSVDRARNAMLSLTTQFPQIIQTTAPQVVLTKLSDSSVDLQLQIWVKPDDYWTVFFAMNQAVYDKFNELGIVIPYNQIDVHVVHDKNETVVK